MSLNLPREQTLKFLCTVPRPAIATHAVKSIVEQVAAHVQFVAVHIYRITEVKTPLTFPWSIIFSFVAPRSYVASGYRSTRAWCELVWGAFVEATKYHPVPIGITAIWMEQRGFGEEHNGASLITSYYSFANGVDPAARNVNMAAHLEMEREQPYYSAVRFNTVVDVALGGGSMFDFVFESYVDAPDGISKIYESPILERMREHSKTFLDIETRRLAFGKVEIVTWREVIR